VECAGGRPAAAVTATLPARFTQEGLESFLVNLQSSICDEVYIVSHWIVWRLQFAESLCVAYMLALIQK